MPGTVADDPVACAAWSRLEAVLPAGTLTALDEALLEIYAVGVSLMRRALDEISRGPLGGVRDGKSPALLVLRQATAQVSQALDRLGLTRAERARLAGPGDRSPDDRNSKFGDLLGSKRA
jgi:P27 family predicted phage terminase small subunit